MAKINAGLLSYVTASLADYLDAHKDQGLQLPGDNSHLIIGADMLGMSKRTSSQTINYNIPWNVLLPRNSKICEEEKSVIIQQLNAVMNEFCEQLNARSSEISITATIKRDNNGQPVLITSAPAMIIENKAALCEKARKVASNGRRMPGL
jgi:hypothetical protein